MFLFILIIILLAKNLIKDRSEFISPRTFFLIGYLFVLGIGALNTSISGYDGNNDVLQDVILWSIIGLLAFEVGTWIKHLPGILQKFFPPDLQLDPKKLFRINVLLSLIGLFALLYFSNSYGLSPIEYILALRTLSVDDLTAPDALRYFAWTINIGIAAGGLAFALLLWVKWGKLKHITLIIIVLLAIPLTIQGGGRYPIFQFMSSLAILWYLQKRSQHQIFHWKKYIAIAALCCIAFMGMSILTQYRNAGLQDIDWSTVNPFTTDKIESDVNTIKSTVNAFEYFPEHHDYLYGSTFAVLPVTYIPRAWWPNKPEALGFVMVDIRTSGNVTYTEAVSTIGELYANFGVFGIPIGMFIYGLICQGLYMFFRHNATNLPFLILYVLSLPFFAMHVRGEFVTVWAHYFSLAIPLYIGMRFCKRRAFQYPVEQKLKILAG